MSTYDMYFSKKNKNYMYEILSKVIHEEVGIQIISSQKYIDLYRLHYPVIFDSISTDEISILNKEIIDRVGNLILMDLRSEPTMKQKQIIKCLKLIIKDIRSFNTSLIMKKKI